MDDANADLPDRPRKRWVRPVIGLALAAFVGIWAFAFWYEAHAPKPEPLDAVSLHAADAACSAAVASLTTIPPVGGAPTVAGRASRVEQENTVLTNLVSELRLIHPSDHDGAKALAAFTTDWRHLIDAREQYVTKLVATQQRPKLFIPVAPTGEPITIRMGEYADIHKLTDCSPDSLQGEVVEGPRTYPRVR